MPRFVHQECTTQIGVARQRPDDHRPAHAGPVQLVVRSGNVCRQLADVDLALCLKLAFLVGGACHHLPRLPVDEQHRTFKRHAPELAAVAPAQRLRFTKVVLRELQIDSRGRLGEHGRSPQKREESAGRAHGRPSEPGKPNILSLAIWVSCVDKQGVQPKSRGFGGYGTHRVPPRGIQCRPFPNTLTAEPAASTTEYAV